MTSAFSWKNSISLCPASFCILRPNLPVTPGVSLLPTFAFQSPIMKCTSFLSVSYKRTCRSSQNHSASSALLVGAQTWIIMIFERILQPKIRKGNDKKKKARMEDKNQYFVTDDCKNLIDSYKGENKKIRTEKILRKEKK